MRASIWDGMAKILQICQKNSILSIKSKGSFITGIQYGPLGSLLKQNIFKEWISSFLNNDDAVLFPLEILKPRQVNFQKCTFIEHSDPMLLEDVVKFYSERISFAGNNLPFGLVTYGLCTQKGQVEDEFHNNSSQILWSPDTWSRGSMVFFCLPVKAMHWFYYWQRHRYLWWRKFSNVPSQFRLSDITQTKNGDQEISLLLECPWGVEKIETITLSVNEYFERMLSNQDVAHKAVNEASNASAAPFIITCELEIDLAVFAYLSNSFVHKWRNRELRSILQFHSKLAPYKVSISICMEDIAAAKKLNDIASLLVKDLKKKGISVFPYSDFKPLTLSESKFIKFDEIGLPYSIVLDETFLKNGIAGLRSRDTTLQEQVHVTEIVDKLVKYLKIMEIPVN